MGISYIQIEHYRSIKKIYLQVSDINTLIGMNGCGKSNILSAVKFFYDHISVKSVVADDDIFDMHNSYSNEVRITFGYDLNTLQKRCRENLKKSLGSRYGQYYEEILSLSSQGKIELTLIAIKGKQIVWNRSFEQRKLLYNLYPIYLVDTRKINLTDWENLWLQIGDLGKLERKEGKEFKENLKKDFLQHAKADKVYKKIEEVFENSNVKIKPASPKQLAAYTANIYFGGNEFVFKENRLVFFSDGTNSFNYIKIFIQILSVLTEMKMKEPMLILDEPEISLHHNYIDELCEVFFMMSKNVNFLIATHSARLIKNILANDNPSHKIYHIDYDGRYTSGRRMEMFQNKRQCVTITDQHANAFFARMIVCVEGRTELELLRNRYLKLVYPVLCQVDVMEGMADGVEQEIISTEKRRYNTPILYTIDMDKVMSFNPSKKRMDFKRNQFKDKDLYSYTNRRADTLQVRRRMMAMAQNCAFRYKMPLFFSADSNLVELKRLIKKYFLEYGYFVMDTTVEGSLITKENLSIFAAFFRETHIQEKNLDVIEQMQQYTKKCYIQEQLNLYRIYYNGKSDLLLGIKELNKKNPYKSDFVNSMYSFLESGKEGKTGGWVSRWLEYFICYALQIEPFREDSYQQVKRRMNTESRSEVRQLFATRFCELNHWMIEIEKRYGGNN